MLIFHCCAMLLLAPEDGTGAGGNGETPPNPPAPAISFASQEKFNERLARHARSYIKDTFGLTDDEVKARIARADELEKTEQARKDAELTEAQRREQELARERERAANLEKELERTKLEKHIASTCVGLGIASVDYAEFLIEKKAASLPDGEQLDIRAYLEEELKNPARRSALGIPESPIQPVPDPANTIPKPDQSPPPPPAPGAGNTGPADAFALDDQAWQKRKGELGIT